VVRVVHSNRTEALLDALAARLGPLDPFDPVDLVVPNRHVERLVELGLALRLGIVVHLRFHRLSGWLREWIGEDLLDREGLSARLLTRLAAPLPDPVYAPLRRYLDAGTGDGRREVQLALRLARLFDEYGASRPDLLAAWGRGEHPLEATPEAETERWQARLYRELRELAPACRTLEEALRAPPPAPARPLHVFGLSYLPPVYAKALDRAGRPVTLYALNPCQEFWEDVAGRRAREATEDPPLLRLWGRPGREHVRLLDALTDCDFDAAFVGPEVAPEASDTALPLFAAGPSLLARLQADILHRAPPADAPQRERDPSLRILACPSVRREVETVASAIWDLVEETPDLRFHEIAVLFPEGDRALYLPQIEAVFRAARHLPHHLTDLPLTSASPLAEVALRLLDLPGSRLTRPEMLAVLLHPAVRPEGVEAAEWSALVERLGILHGLDAAEHAGTALQGAPPSWSEGLGRLGLGALSDHPLGALWSEPVPLTGDAPEATFARLTRSLLADVAFAREARLPLGDWGRFFAAMVGTYLSPRDEGEAGVRRRLVEALEGLARLQIGATTFPYAAAWELARHTLDALRTARGQTLADGVVVSSIRPMRALPFEAIFVLGLGEGRFPASERRDALDLRSAERRLGDVEATERDRYSFLELLLCARDRLVLSFVARNERTGEALAPSAVVEELLEVLDAGYLQDARHRLVAQLPLRRHAAQGLARHLPAAAEEEDAARRGRALREAAIVAPDRWTPEALARRASHVDLGLAPLPPAARAPVEDRVVQLSELRGFLQSPLQAWARSCLRLRTPDDAEEAARADEPLEAERRATVIVLREAFEAHLLEGAPLTEGYREARAGFLAQGRWPTGRLGAVWAEEHLAVLEAWREAWGDRAPPGRLRFGAGDTAKARGAPALRLEFDGPAGTSSVRLEGATALLSEGPRASVLALDRVPTKAALRRRGLDAFVDQLVLTAAGMAGPHGVLVLTPEPPARHLELPPLSAEAARGQLTALLRDLLFEPHAYRLPADAVLAGRDGEEVVRHVLKSRDGGQDRYGPIRGFEDLAPPTPGLAEAMIARRFGAYPQIAAAW
jgi:exodeoxyribonuclease V gamma subunit